ncbi:aminotransferase class V-fold PLP-dependent enzyme [Quadrisphaera setariae]|uniref:Cysteine desulfurase n=1 Tax=Quadrisphaera setariae TaxID=2593304 RepID=A0A5C8ZF81_9ACTN|nr:SufS family cysteine desulfurase [Quadrisphaera setariae]TXR55460.1 SufS family cysteine desulfurase [Quadrisphaera setariae]
MSASPATAEQTAEQTAQQAADEPRFDPAAVRDDFPLLGVEVNGEPLVYLDSAATSQRPRAVLDAERSFLETVNSAVHRGAHTLAAEATELFEGARETVAGFVGAGPEQLVWTSGATAGLNLVAYSLGNAAAGRTVPGHEEAARRWAPGPGDEIVVTEAEHHANLVPWLELAARTGASVRAVPVRDDGTLDLEAAASLLSTRTRVLAFSHVSNVLGVVNPVEQLVALAREATGGRALTVLDACQSAPHLPLDLPALGVDVAVFSGHKVLGPNGVGALYGRAEVLEALPPFLLGGSMITTVTLEGAQYLPPPQRFEAGTQPVSQAVALAAAVDYQRAVTDRFGATAVLDHERALEHRLRHGLRGMPGIRLLGDAGEGAERVALQAFEVEGVHAHDVGQLLDARGVAVRVGHHCAQPLHRRFGTTASVRASAALYTTEADVDVFLDALAGVRSYFGVGR